MTTITLDRVSHSYRNGTAALNEVSLSIAAGEFVAVLGPSGCGKSSLLRVLAGLLAPSHGRCVVPQADAVGFVFQAPTLMPWASVADNVALPLRIRARRSALTTLEQSQRVSAELERVGLSAFAMAHPAELSGGMQMRVSVARALVTQPKLLLMDEPFAALDEITRQRLADDLLGVWRQQGFTVVFVTHNVFEAVYLSQRVLVMSARPGRICADVRIAQPLQGAAWRGSPGYLASCVELSQALEQAMGSAAVIER